MTEHQAAPRGARPAAVAVTVDSGRTQRELPQATVTRLATYLRALVTLADDGVQMVSSEELAAAAGVNSAKLRKDLSFLGSNGVRGVGYDVRRLHARIEAVLGLSEGHRVILVGAGHLGRALLGYGGFRRRGFTMVGVFDNDPRLIGQELGGLRVRDIAEIRRWMAVLRPTIGVLAVPDEVAQQVCDRLVAVGVRSLLSFAAAQLVVPDSVQVRRVDLAVELQMLSFDQVRTGEMNAVRPATAPRSVSAPADRRHGGPPHSRHPAPSGHLAGPEAVIRR